MSQIIPRPKQIPTIALDVEENRHLSIRFNARNADESDACGDHPGMHRIEIVDAKKESNPAGELLTSDGFLTVTICACEQNAGTTARWTHDDPSLRTPVIRERRNVFDELELEHVHEELDRRIVLPNNQRNEIEA